MRPMSQTKFAILSLFALAIFATLLALGNWQISRLAWKEERIRTIQSRIHQPPRPLETYLKSDLGADYWPVTITGTFRHEGERHFFATHQGKSGYYVYTPLQLASGSYIFVNRGFVNFDMKNANLRSSGQTQGSLSITGLTRSILTEKPSASLPDNDVANNIFYWQDFAAMRNSAGLPENAVVIEIMIDANQTATPPSGMPIGGVTLIDLPNNHLSYAFTWYALAATLLAIWSISAWRQRRAL